ncbi:MAG: glutamate--cysteine ligase [Pseudomonadota bacterium]|nr:glutamate--cysteine ligase [Pseudomonadota bacterium]
MGEEIETTRFTREDYQNFQHRLRVETDLLEQWFRDEAFVSGASVAGFELEACLIDREYMPAPDNTAVLARCEPDRVSPELARFNVEMNGDPQVLAGGGLSRLADELERSWSECQEAAAARSLQLATIGILPTIRRDHLHAGNMSPMKRYAALNEQLLQSRHARPIRLDITGEEELHVSHPNVMLESVATSLQIHLQLRPHDALRFFHAAMAVSAPMVAVSANSPYLFDHDLWAETRIPVFEQSVDFRGVGAHTDEPSERVCFGHGYPRGSLMACFRENLADYPVLLPIHFDEGANRLPCLRFHNGTIWRWNRPLIGFDASGRPHLRVEHRVVAAGPSIPDMVADMAFFLGLVHALGQAPSDANRQDDFEQVRANFYAAAKGGLDARIRWAGSGPVPISDLIIQKLVPLAREGLQSLELDPRAIAEYLEIILMRARTGRNGCHWQRAYVRKHGRDMVALTAAYLERQATQTPVHEWTL